MDNELPPEPSVQAPPLGEDRLGAPNREYDAPFTQCYRDLMTSLVRFLRWQGAPLDVAVEIAQDTMAQLYRRWPDVRDRRAWTRQVASRRWGRRVAEVTREQPADLNDMDAHSGVGDLDRCVGAPWLVTTDQIRVFEQHHDVLRLLDTLPMRQRQVLAWTYDGYTPAEIAKELQVTPESVRANLFKARRAMRDQMGKKAQ